MPRNPDHRGATKEEFERFQRERPIMLRQIATIWELWRMCGRKDCRRAKACTGPNGDQCAGEFISTALSEEERATFQEAIRLRSQGADADTAWCEAERKIAAHKAQIEAVPGMRGERFAGRLL
ncbi:hypothetical protein ASE66_16020 [Bosea sp. Root483D1]|uniref:hypothetical protein n=1 Tax=Bosea sp. Root483D1 TaxID=1736544 RepID=UPI00070D393D|nr:hypothetical protein [Bosea sp. Root483D1]KRE14835.1 hypothetical protein ASE66_16020 [Bosea sp. Root483D1]